MYKYEVRKDYILDEENVKHTVYGIEVRQNDKLIKAITNVFLDLKKAESFVALCNSEELELIHLMDVIEDIL